MPTMRMQLARVYLTENGKMMKRLLLLLTLFLIPATVTAPILSEPVMKSNVSQTLTSMKSLNPTLPILTKKDTFDKLSPLTQSEKTKRPLETNLVASWYGLKFNGRLTANGEIFDDRFLTVASPTLRFG